MGIVCPMVNYGPCQNLPGNYLYYAIDCDSQAPQPLYSTDPELPLGCCDAPNDNCFTNSVASPLLYLTPKPATQYAAHNVTNVRPPLSRKLHIHEGYPITSIGGQISQLDSVDCKFDVPAKASRSSEQKSKGKTAPAPGAAQCYVCRLFLIKIAPSGYEPLYLRHGFELEGCSKSMVYLSKGHLIGGTAPRFQVAHGGLQYEVVLAVPPH